jgi:ribosome-binding protein aMBF1 (putative translation factor)
MEQIAHYNKSKLILNYLCRQSNIKFRLLASEENMTNQPLRRVTNIQDYLALRRDTEAQNPIDPHVAMCIRTRRLLLRMSEETLAERLRINLRQLQAYEAGTQRVSADHLVSIADILDVSISYFFKDL